MVMHLLHLGSVWGETGRKPKRESVRKGEDLNDIVGCYKEVVTNSMVASNHSS